MNKGTTKCESKCFKAISVKLCKHHFLKLVKLLLRKEFRELYRHSDMAFGSMDMSGTGVIDIARFMNSIACQRLVENSRKNRISTSNYNTFVLKLDDIRQFCLHANVFDLTRGETMAYQAFRTTFFPQLCHAQADEKEGDDMDSEKGAKENKTRGEMKSDPNG